MIITALTGQTVTPVVTADIAAERGLYLPGAGTYATVAPTLAEEYGRTAESIAVDIELINAALLAGKMIFAGGAGADPFTRGGHYIVIRGITENGNWLVGDSGHSDTSTRTWSPEELIVQMLERPANSYAISRSI